MKTRRLLAFGLALLGLSIVNLPLSTAFAQGTAFIYQGRLHDGGAAANGLYEMSFALHDAVTNGNAVAGPLTNAPVVVSDGLFAVTLDFGAGAFPGANRWLEIAVRTNGSEAAHTPLSPRQPLTPTPYALTAGAVTGVIPVTQLPAVVVTNGASGVTISGVFTGSGAGLTNIHSLAAADGSPAPAVFVDNNGKVGIGTTNPVSQVANAGLRVANAGHVVVNNNFGFFSVDQSGAGFGAGVDTSPTDDLQLIAGSSPVVTLTASGRVGIGTTTPLRLLHVQGDAEVGGSVTIQGNNHVRGFNVVTHANVVVTTGTILSPSSGFTGLIAAGPVTLGLTTAIADGVSLGQMLILRGTSNTATVTINDNANTALGANRVLGLNDTLSLIWNGSEWVELSFANN